MSITFKPDTRELESAIAEALASATLFAQAKIAEITPRDLERLPQDIDRKDGKAPRRSTYFKPVNIGGHWYAGVSGQLKRSVASETVSWFETKIGVSEGPASDYAKYLEFWTRRMAPRSFLRKWLEENAERTGKVFRKTLKSLLW